jgi:hypothetical protein
LVFDLEVLVDKLTLPKPVNYVVVRIIPPANITPDPRKRPFIIFDPRAGHGPGIGGMTHDSETRVALRAGHPCYFAGFLYGPNQAKRSRTSAALRRISFEPSPSGTGTPMANRW